VRHIPKSAEPRGLVAYRKTPGARYDALPRETREELRDALLRDQGHLCAYCSQRIRADEMKVEHRVPQSVDSAQQLTWKNLLGCCRGGEGSSPKEQHCDTRKGDAEVTIDPTSPRCEAYLRYAGDGRITADDPAVARDLDDTLNLNLPKFVRNRNAVLEAFFQGMRRRFPDAAAWDRALPRELTALCAPDVDGHLREHVGYVVWWIQRRLRR
jgi:uncharacterized protein (TIGR02646 family)